MEYTEANFLTADKRPTDIKASKENIIEYPVLLFPNYSSVAHQAFMEIHDKNLIQDFHKNKEEIKYYIKLNQDIIKKFNNMSRLKKMLMFIGVLDIIPTNPNQKSIKNLQDANIRIATEYKNILSRIIQPNEKLTLKAHATHYYTSGIPIIDKKTQEKCDDMFSKGQFLTLNIEDTTDDLYFLFFHNWIMAPIIKSYEEREALNINEAIQQI